MITDDLKYGWQATDQSARIRDHRDPDLGSRDRRQHRRVLAGGCGDAEVTAVSRSRSGSRSLGAIYTAMARWSSEARGLAVRDGRPIRDQAKTVRCRRVFGHVGAGEPGKRRSDDDGDAAARERRLLPCARRAAGDRPRVHASKKMWWRSGGGDLERSLCGDRPSTATPPLSASRSCSRANRTPWSASCRRRSRSNSGCGPVDADARRR